MLFISIHGTNKSGHTKEIVLIDQTDIQDIQDAALAAGLSGEVIYKRSKAEDGKITVLHECRMKIESPR